MDETPSAKPRPESKGVDALATEPVAILTRAVRHVRPGRALDAGTREGRNALYLAKEGFAVTAWDLEPNCIESLRERAQDKQIKAEVHDIRDLEGAGSFNIIVLTNVLHQLPKQDAVALIANAQKSTNPGGLDVVVTSTKDGDYYKRPGVADNFYPERDELKTMYEQVGWEIIEYVETVHDKKLPDGKISHNVKAQLIARKPGQADAKENA